MTYNKIVKKVIFLPFAGANKYSYQQFHEHLRNTFDLFTVELPGRGARIQENFITDMEHVIDDIYNQIKEFVNGCEYFLYGHSMGGTLGNLLIHKLMENNDPLPIHFLVTGHGAPQFKKEDNIIRHKLTNIEFKEELKDCEKKIMIFGITIEKIHYHKKK